jgi:ATP-dependent RNA helicase MSS116
VQVAVGGTQKSMMLRQVQREGCHLLVGTPGRLSDILSDSYSGIKAPNLDALVMDEADRLLDMGFSKEIDDIKNLLPNTEERDRQNMMFSATLSREVVDIVRKTLKPGFHFAQCVDQEEAPTHDRVPQKVVHMNGFENIMPVIYEMILRELQNAKAGVGRPFKAIVYFNSTAEVTLAASVYYKLSGGFKRDRPLYSVRGFEIHSKLSQAQRTKAAENFRFAESGILFSSDVTSRGMDFPNVTHVIQVGLPRDRDSYIHRLGRTARAGKEGEGWLLLTPLEQNEMRKRLSRLPLKEDTTLETAAVDMSTEGEMPENVATILQEIVEAHKKVYPDQLDAAFKGLFGSFAWHGDKQLVVDLANRWAEFGWGMPEPPRVPAAFLSGGRARGRSGGNGGSGGFGDRDRGRGGSGFGAPRSGGFGDKRSSGGFGDRAMGGSGDRGDRGGFGGRGGDRGGFSSRGGDRGGFGSRGGDRGGLSSRGDRGDRGDRGNSRGGFGDRPPREKKPNFDF